MVTLLQSTTDNIKKLVQELQNEQSHFKVILYGQEYEYVNSRNIKIKDSNIDLVLPGIIVYLKKYECSYYGKWLINTKTGKITIEKY